MNLLKESMRFMVAALLFAPISYAVESNLSVSSSDPVYDRFLLYMSAAEDRDENLSVFFSKKVNEYLLGVLLKERGAEADLFVLEKVRNRMRFADRIDSVIEYSVDTVTDKKKVLKLICVDPGGDAYLLEITYVKANSVWLIDHRSYKNMKSE